MEPCPKCVLIVGDIGKGVLKNVDEAADVGKGIDNASDTFKEGTRGGNRAGKEFTPKGKKEVIDANKQKNSGQTVCEDCGSYTVTAQKAQRGVSPPGNETQVDHIYPKSLNGDGVPSNGQVLCRDCNLSKGNKTPDEYYKNGGN